MRDSSFYFSSYCPFVLIIRVINNHNNLCACYFLSTRLSCCDISRIGKFLLVYSLLPRCFFTKWNFHPAIIYTFWEQIPLNLMELITKSLLHVGLHYLITFYYHWSSFLGHKLKTAILQLFPKSLSPLSWDACSSECFMWLFSSLLIFILPALTLSVHTFYVFFPTPTMRTCTYMNVPDIGCFQFNFLCLC